MEIIRSLQLWYLIMYSIQQGMNDIISDMLPFIHSILVIIISLLFSVFLFWEIHADQIIVCGECAP